MTEIITDEEIVALRKKAKTRFTIIVIIGVTTFLLILVLGTNLFYTTGDNIFFAILQSLVVDVVIHCAWVAMLYFIIGKSAYDKFNTTFKNKYVLKTIEETNLFENVSYDMNGGFTHENIENSGVVNSGEKSVFLTEDMIKGYYKNVHFYFSDVTTRKIVHRNKKTRIDNIFNGQIMRFAMFDDLKTSDEYVQVFEKEILSDIKGWTAKHKIETENTQFNNKFKIYASKEHNAFYILTPLLMEKILEFSQSINEQISLCFYGKVMYVAINRFGSIFDGKIDMPISEQKELILSDIRLLQKAGDILLQVCFEDSVQELK